MIAFYTLSTLLFCIAQRFKNIENGFEKFCSISIETCPFDSNARNKRDGKWLIMSQSLNVTVKYNQKVSIQIVKSPIDILNLDLGCSGHHGSLLLPVYYNEETHYNVTNSFQNFLDELQTN
jgi:hypothetical protein